MITNLPFMQSRMGVCTPNYPAMFTVFENDLSFSVNSNVISNEVTEMQQHISGTVFENSIATQNIYGEIIDGTVKQTIVSSKNEIIDGTVKQTIVSSKNEIIEIDLPEVLLNTNICTKTDINNLDFSFSLKADISNLDFSFPLRTTMNVFQAKPYYATKISIEDNPIFIKSKLSTKDFLLRTSILQGITVEALSFLVEKDSLPNVDLKSTVYSSNYQIVSKVSSIEYSLSIPITLLSSVRDMTGIKFDLTSSVSGVVIQLTGDAYSEEDKKLVISHVNSQIEKGALKLLKNQWNLAFLNIPATEDGKIATVGNTLIPMLKEASGVDYPVSFISGVDKFSGRECNFVYTPDYMTELESQNDLPLCSYNEELKIYEPNTFSILVLDNDIEMNWDSATS